MQQISADVFPFANGAKNARYYRATALRVGVCLPAGCFRSRFRFWEAAVVPRRAIAKAVAIPTRLPVRSNGVAGRVMLVGMMLFSRENCAQPHLRRKYSQQR